MKLLRNLFSKKQAPEVKAQSQEPNLLKCATVIDEDGVAHKVPENGAIAQRDKEHCFVCNSEYFHLWLGCYFLKKESENYTKPIYFKKISDLTRKNTCPTCFDYVTSDNYTEWDFE